MERLNLTKSSLRKALDDGKNRKQMAEMFGISQGQIKMALQAVKLDKVRPSTRKFNIIDDEAVVEEPQVVAESVITQEVNS